MWQLVGILNALSNGKLNKFIIYSLLLQVIHFYMKEHNKKSTCIPVHTKLLSPESFIIREKNNKNSMCRNFVLCPWLHSCNLFISEARTVSPLHMLETVLYVSTLVEICCL